MIRSSRFIKSLRLVHLILASAWVGAGLGLAVAQKALPGLSAELVPGVLAAMAMINKAVVVPSAFGVLITGVLFSTLGGWGFLRHRMIILKYALAVLSILAGALLLGPWMRSMAAMVRDLGAAQALADPDFLSLAAKSFRLGLAVNGALALALGITVFRPWLGKARPEAPNGAEPAPDPAATKVRRYPVAKGLLIIPALALGIFLVVTAVKSRKGPSRPDMPERVRAVRVIPAPQVSAVPRAMGYGMLKPGKVWDAVSELGGKVVYMNSALDEGALISAGEKLLEIDPTEYKLALSRAKSDITSIRARLAELARRKKNLQATLDVEKRSMALFKKELQRKRGLVKDGNIALSEVDQEEKLYYAQKNAVQKVENSLNLIPAERDSLMAELNSAETRLENARLDLGKTVITAPFDCRVAALNVEKSQYVKAGQVMIQAESTKGSEVQARIPLAQFRDLLPSGGDDSAPLSLVGLPALVRVRLGDGYTEFNGTVSRMAESIDPKTRTMGVYVAVDQGPGEDTALLLKNLFCAVEVLGAPVPGVVAVPRRAVVNGDVHLAGDDDRLITRPIVRGLSQGGFVVVEKGLLPGERVIVSDVSPAVEGMLLEPVEDNATLETLILEAEAR